MADMSPRTGLRADADARMGQLSQADAFVGAAAHRAAHRVAMSLSMQYGALARFMSPAAKVVSRPQMPQRPLRLLKGAVSGLHQASLAGITRAEALARSMSPAARRHDDELAIFGMYSATATAVRMQALAAAADRKKGSSGPGIVLANLKQARAEMSRSVFANASAFLGGVRRAVADAGRQAQRLERFIGESAMVVSAKARNQVVQMSERMTPMMRVASFCGAAAMMVGLSQNVSPQPTAYADTIHQAGASQPAAAAAKPAAHTAAPATSSAAHGRYVALHHAAVHATAHVRHLHISHEASAATVAAAMARHDDQMRQAMEGKLGLSTADALNARELDALARLSRQPIPVHQAAASPEISHDVPAVETSTRMVAARPVNVVASDELARPGTETVQEVRFGEPVTVHRRQSNGLQDARLDLAQFERRLHQGAADADHTIHDDVQDMVSRVRSVF